MNLAVSSPKRRGRYSPISIFHFRVLIGREYTRWATLVMPADIDIEAVVSETILRPRCHLPRKGTTSSFEGLRQGLPEGGPV